MTANAQPTTLLSLLTWHPESVRSTTALIIPHTTSDRYTEISYGKLTDSVLDVRTKLRKLLSVQKGNVVATSFTNGLEFVATFLGIGAARAVAAPLNPAYSTNEVKFYLDDTKPVLFLLPRISDIPANSPSLAGAKNALQAAKELSVKTAEVWVNQHGALDFKVILGSSSPRSGPSPDDGDPLPQDITLVLHTSGTTGRPKSVPLSHHNLVTTTKNVVNTYSLTAQDRSYLVMPLFHVHGLLAGLLSPLRSGGSIVIPERFSASRFWKDFSSTNCTWYTAVPTIHTMLLNSPLPSTIPPIRFIRSCSSALPPIIHERLEKTLKAPVLEAYAMTEAAHQMTSNIVSSNIPGTVGLGIGVQISIRDMTTGLPLLPGSIGEVCVRGENVTQGYWNNEKANRESFWEPTAKEAKHSQWGDRKWFRTGDQGLMLASPAKPHVKLTGRIKELINRGGEKISPLEIDAALLRVEGVKEAVAFGVEDDVFGEVVWAGVVLHGDKQVDAKAEEQRIRDALKGSLSKFKIPDRIIITQQIPKTATGKVQRRHVKDALAKQANGKAKAKL